MNEKLNSQWWYELNGQQIGPISEEELLLLISDGVLNSESLVWKKGIIDWIKIKDCSLNAIKNTDDKVWWYQYNNQKMGPINEEELIHLIETNVLKSDSIIWCKEFNSWIEIKNSRLAKFLNFNFPPPIEKKGSINNIIWWLAFAPLIGSLIEGILIEIFYPQPDNLIGYFEYILTTDFHSFWFITLALNVFLSYQDEKLLKKNGYDTSKLGTAFLIPVYLYKRAEMLKQNNSYFWVWLVLFILSLG